MENVRRIKTRDTADNDAFDQDPPDDERALQRTPPQDLDAEQSVLAAMLTSRTAIEEAVEALDPGDYYRPAHETIHRAIVDLAVNGEPADPITVADALRKTGQLDRIGGPTYLHHLVGQLVTAANVGHYAEIVRDMAVRRRLVEAGIRITQLGYAADGDVAELVEAVRKEADDATTAAAHGPGHLAGAILDWPELFGTDFGNVQLLPGKLLAPGQQTTVVGDGKAGKSLFIQEWAWRAATGQAFLDDRPQAPIPILYCDAENGQQQVQERFLSFGAAPHTMGLLKYASFPHIRPLDTAGGGADLMNLAKATGAHVVVIDTVSRFISGPENDADTWLALYRHTLMPLKAAGIASIRLDHLGKDGDRGARGSSAKTQDVDHVWTLQAQGGGMLALKRTHTRTGIGPDAFAIRRDARRYGDTWIPGATRHVVVHFEHVEQNIPGSDAHIIMRLAEAGVPLDAGNRVVKAKLAELQIAAGSDKVSRVVKIRQNQAKTDHAERSPERSPDPFPETFPGNVPRNGSRDGKAPGQTFPGNAGGTSGTPPVPPIPPTQWGGGEGTQEQHQPQDPPSCTLCGHPINNTDRVQRGYDTHLMCPTGPTNAPTPNAPEED